MNFGEDMSLAIMLAHKSYNTYLSNVLKEVDVYQHYQIILLLNRNGGRATQKKLCEQLQIEKSNMVAIIELLVTKGYVTKVVDYKDRRSKLITATPKSAELLERLDSTFASIDSHVADEVTWQEMHNCLRVLTKVSDKIRGILNPPAKVKAGGYSYNYS